MKVLHRSGLETYDKCPRMFYYNYHYHGIGIVRSEPNLDLAIGIGVHVGIADMITEFNKQKGGLTVDYVKVCANHAAVTVSNCWREYKEELREQPNSGTKWNWTQGCEIAKGLVWCFYLCVLPELVKKYKFVGVEVPVSSEVWKRSGVLMVTRIDLILEDRESGDRYLVNYKTAKLMDERMESRHSHDLQSVTEVMLYEDYMKELKKEINKVADGLPSVGFKEEIGEKIRQLTAKVVDTVAGTKLVYLFKGYHKKIVDSSGQDTGKVASYAPFIRGYKKVGEDGEVSYAYAYEYQTADGKNARLGSKWKPFQVYEEYPGGVSQWILDIWSGKIQQEVDGREKLMESVAVGWDWMKREKEIEEERKEIQDRYYEIDIMNAEKEDFRKHRHSCDYPSRCPYQGLCFEGEEVFGDGGRFKYRIPHHEEERESLKEVMKEKGLVQVK